MAYTTKGPADTTDRAFDWSTWLPQGDSIVSSTWTVPTGLTKVREELIGSTAVVWLSGGAEGYDYTVTNHITTAQGRIKSDELTVHVTSN